MRIFLIFLIAIFSNLESENMKVEKFDLGLQGAKRIDYKGRKMFVNIDEATSFAKIDFKKIKDGKSGLPTKPKSKLQIVDSDIIAAANSQRDFAVWLGHSSIFLHTNDFNILVDPIFSKYGSPVFFINRAFKASKYFSAKDFPKLHAVIITHSHYDHLDKKAIKVLKAQAELFITPIGNGKFLKKYGVKEEQIIELDWWSGVKLSLDSEKPESKNAPSKSIKITATPQQHSTMRFGQKKNETLWASFVVELLDSKLLDSVSGAKRRAQDSQNGIYRIYLSGDGAYAEHFKSIGEHFGRIDFAFLENGQYNPAWSFNHTFATQNTQVAQDLNAKVIFPIHWGKFKLSNHGWSEPIEILQKLAEKSNIPLMTRRIGQIFYFDEKPTNDFWYREF